MSDDALTYGRNYDPRPEWHRRWIVRCEVCGDQAAYRLRGSAVFFIERHTCPGQYRSGQLEPLPADVAGLPDPPPFDEPPLEVYEQDRGRAFDP